MEGGMVVLPMKVFGKSGPMKYHSTEDCETSTTVLILMPSLGLQSTQLCLSCSQMDPSQPLQQTQLFFLKENCSSLHLSVITPTTKLLLRMKRILTSKQKRPYLGMASLWQSWKVGPCSFSTSLWLMWNLLQQRLDQSTLKMIFLPNYSSSLIFFDFRLLFLTGEYSSVSRYCRLGSEDLRSSMLFSRCRMRLLSFRFYDSFSLRVLVTLAQTIFVSSSSPSLSLKVSYSCATSLSLSASLACSSLRSLLSLISPVGSTSSRGRWNSLILPMMLTSSTMPLFSTFTLLLASSETKKQISCTFSKITLNSMGRLSQEYRPMYCLSLYPSYSSKVMRSCEQLTRMGCRSAVLRVLQCCMLKIIWERRAGLYSGDGYQNYECYYQNNYIIRKGGKIVRLFHRNIISSCRLRPSSRPSFPYPQGPYRLLPSPSPSSRPRGRPSSSS